MLSFFVGPVAAPAAFVPPLSPNPFPPPPGRKGEPTATFGYCAPNTWLQPEGRHCHRTPRLQTCSRREHDAVARVNGGRLAARVRSKEFGVVACINGGRTAARSVRATSFASTTTAGSPTQAPTNAAQPPSRNSLFGAQPPNRYSAPLSALARVERGWGIGGVFKSPARNIKGQEK